MKLFKAMFCGGLALALAQPVIAAPGDVDDDLMRRVTKIVDDQSLEFHGYFRAGVTTGLDGGSGGSGEGAGNGACYALKHPMRGDGLFYRFGNECRGSYGEMVFVKKGEVNGLKYRGVMNTNLAGNRTGPTDNPEWDLETLESFVEVTNALDNGAKIWIGRRFYRSIAVGDVHIIDAFHVNSRGDGVGVTDIPIGADHKLHTALMIQGDTIEDNRMFDVRGDFGLGGAGRLKVALQLLMNNHADRYDYADSGETEQVTTFVRDDNGGLVSDGSGGFRTETETISVKEDKLSLQDDDSTDGNSITLQWEKNFGNGLFDQKTVLQMGSDAFAVNPGCFSTSACFDTGAEQSGRAGMRIFNNASWTFTDRFIVNTMLMMEDIDPADHNLLKEDSDGNAFADDYNLTADDLYDNDLGWSVTSIGIRPHYKLSDYWSLIGEIGMHTIENEGGNADKDAGTVVDGVSQSLQKISVGVQLTPDGGDFWARPSLRFYLSQFSWDEDTALINGGKLLATGGDPDKTDAMLLGAQAEFWW